MLFASRTRSDVSSTGSRSCATACRSGSPRPVSPTVSAITSWSLIAAISEHDVIADTVGLTGLGLPDLQAIAHDRDPVELASLLVRLAKSMFVGDALDFAWTEEQSLVLPFRDAITVQLD